MKSTFYKILIGLHILLISCSSDLTDQEKQDAWNSYLDEDVEIIDLAIHYELTRNYLTLVFEQPPVYDTWMAEIVIVDSSGQTLHHFRNEESEFLDTVRFIDGKLEFSGFLLGDNDPVDCEIWLYGAPVIPDKELYANPIFGIPYTMIDKEGDNILTPWPQFYDVDFLTFNERMLDTLSNELREYCLTRKKEYLTSLYEDFGEYVLDPKVREEAIGTIDSLFKTDE